MNVFRYAMAVAVAAIGLYHRVNERRAWNALRSDLDRAHEEELLP